MKLLLIRHPEPDVTKGLCYGQTDVPLLVGWQNDAQSIGDWLKRYHDNVAWKSFHSPLSRAALLAKAVISGSQEIDALAELDFGSWENVCWSDIPREEIDQWSADLEHAVPYGGESLAMLSKRVLSWLDPQIRANQDTILFTHAGVIKVLVAHFCHMPLAQCFRTSPTYSSITELEVGEGYAMLHRLGAGDWTH